MNDGELLGVAIRSSVLETMSPGGCAEVDIQEIYDAVDYSLLAPGVRFSICEGAREVGNGMVMS